MTTQFIRSAVILLLASTSLVRQANAGPLFHDDFQDGSVSDGQPVTWLSGLEPWEPQSRQVQDGSYLVATSNVPAAPNATWTEGDTFVADLQARAVTVRTQARGPESGVYFLGVLSRYTYTDNELEGGNVYGDIDANGDVSIGYAVGPNISEVQRVKTPLSPRFSDVVLELTVDSQSAKFFAWAEGDERPAAPQVTISRLPRTLPTHGSVGVYFGGVNMIDEQGAFRYVEVSSSVVGDFDLDGVLTATDIDALSASLRAGEQRTLYDVNDDGSVDESDRVEWVVERRRTYFGDADLNGEFSSEDLVAVLTAGHYEQDSPASWASGDWSGDAVFDSTDLVLALGDGGYEQGPRAAIAAVPEPTSSWLLLAGPLGLSSLRRLKSRDGN